MNIMVLHLWKYLWNKTQASLKYIKIALCIFVTYLLILSIFASVFHTNKKNLYPPISSTVPISKNDQIRAFITDKQINSTKTGRLIVKVYKGTVCSLIGEACYADLDKVNPSNASTALASVLIYPFLNPPASGVGATMQTLAQAGFIPKSYAAEGVGFASLRPLMGVWRAMRDIAYMLLVLVIVTIGFMIMLRTKINPQTIVNVENALPKIVMSLIYITFSFAIAGFLIDLMYVIIALIIGILGPQYSAVAPSTGYILLGGPRTTQELMKTFLVASPWDIIGLMLNFNVLNIFWNLPNALLNIVGGGISVLIRIIITIASAIFLSPYINTFVASHFKDIDFQLKAGVVFAELGVVGLVSALLRSTLALGTIGIAIVFGSLAVPLILGLVIFLTVLLLFFRIFLLLFSNYIKLLVLIIISPIFLLMEAVPGQSAFTTWVRSIIELLVTFPVIIATFLIGAIIMGTSTGGVLWTPPFMVGLNPESLSPIIGTWILFMIPDFIGIAQKAINPKPIPLDAGIGTFFGGAKTGIETGMSELGKVALIAPRIKPLNSLLNTIGMGIGMGGPDGKK